MTLATILGEMEYVSTIEKLDEKFLFLAKKINEVLSKIKKCETLEEAEHYFALLERIHVLLTKIYYVKKISLPEYLWDFMRDFERIDADITQQYLYRDIRSNTYHLINLDI